MPAGRPSDYTPEMAAFICPQIADGRPLKTICAPAKMPDRVTVYRWMAANEEFRNAYARAREEQADTLAEQIVGIADRCKDPNKARVMIDARKWVAAKMRPKVYGDKLDVEHGGNVTVNLTGSDAAL